MTPNPSRKSAANKLTVMASLILSVIYVVGCHITKTTIDPTVMTFAFMAIGGATMTHHWANAQEHKAKSGTEVSKNDQG